MRHIAGLLRHVAHASVGALALVAGCKKDQVTNPITGCVGEEIAFSEFVGSEDRPRLFYARPDGSGRNSLSETARGYTPVWSPDGCEVAFTIPQGDRSSDIAIMQADGRALRRITSDAAFDADPEWSPDGRRIVFQSERSGAGDIWLIGVDGSNPVNVTRDAQYNWQPSWSPDGTRIAFCTDTETSPVIDPDALDVANIDGSGRVRLVASDVAGCGDWSPDGSKILFTTQNLSARTTSVEVIGADGTGRETIWTSQGFAYQPSWSPDGAKIVFAADPRPGVTGVAEAVTQLYVINADGSGLRRITNSARSSFGPDWRR